MECPHCGGRVKNGACQNCTTPVDLPDTPEANASATGQEIPRDSSDIPIAHDGFAALLRIAKADDVPDLETAAQRWLESVLSLTDGYEIDPVSLFEEVPEGVPAREATEFVACTHSGICAKCFLPLSVEWEAEWSVGQAAIMVVPPGRVRDALGALTRRFVDPAELAIQAASLLGAVGCLRAKARSVIRTPCRCDNQGQVFLATLGD